MKNENLKKQAKVSRRDKKVKVKPFGFLEKSPPFASLRVVFFQKTLTFLSHLPWLNGFLF